ncbi:MAG: hypothetical protein ABI459_00305 [Deltaproteobacteria bacterium]
MAQGKSQDMKIVLGITVALAASPAAAFDLAKCYARTYSAEHLASHPAQMVSDIWVAQTVENVPSPGVVLNFSVRLKTSREVYLGGAYCEPDGADIRCGMEGDAGSFTIKARKNGILIALDPDGISFEGQSGFVTLSGSKGDDREFLLPLCP